MKKFLLLLFCGVCVMSVASAQSSMNGFSGTVRDQNGEPLPFPSVNLSDAKIAGNSWGSDTALEDGVYKIDITKEQCDELSADTYWIQATNFGCDANSIKVSKSDFCGKVNKLDLTLLCGTTPNEAVVYTSIEGCRIEGVVDPTVFTATKQKWKDLRKMYNIEPGDFHTDSDNKAFIAASVECAERLKADIETAELGFSDLEIKDCNVGAAGQMVEYSLKPRFQAGLGGGCVLRGDARDITYWLQRFGKKIAGAIAAVAVFFVVWNAFNILLARGDADEISKAKKALTWIIYGLLITIFAYVIIKTVISLTYMQ